MRRLATLLACCAMAGESAHAWTAISSRQARVAGRSCVVLRLRGGLAKRRRTYLRYWLDEHGNRVYTVRRRRVCASASVLAWLADTREHVFSTPCLSVYACP